MPNKSIMDRLIEKHSSLFDEEERENPTPEGKSGDPIIDRLIKKHSSLFEEEEPTSFEELSGPYDKEDFLSLTPYSETEMRTVLGPRRFQEAHKALVSDRERAQQVLGKEARVRDFLLAVDQVKEGGPNEKGIKEATGRKTLKDAKIAYKNLLTKQLRGLEQMRPKGVFREGFYRKWKESHPTKIEDAKPPQPGWISQAFGKFLGDIGKSGTHINRAVGFLDEDEYKEMLDKWTNFEEAWPGNLRKSWNKEAAKPLARMLTESAYGGYESREMARRQWEFLISNTPSTAFGLMGGSEFATPEAFGQEKWEWLSRPFAEAIPYFVQLNAISGSLKGLSAGSRLGHLITRSAAAGVVSQLNEPDPSLTDALWSSGTYFALMGVSDVARAGAYKALGKAPIGRWLVGLEKSGTLGKAMSSVLKKTGGLGRKFFIDNIDDHVESIMDSAWYALTERPDGSSIPEAFLAALPSSWLVNVVQERAADIPGLGGAGMPNVSKQMATDRVRRVLNAQARDARKLITSERELNVEEKKTFKDAIEFASSPRKFHDLDDFFSRVEPIYSNLLLEADKLRSKPGRKPVALITEGQEGMVGLTDDSYLDAEDVVGITEPEIYPIGSRVYVPTAKEEGFVQGRLLEHTDEGTKIDVPLSGVNTYDQFFVGLKEGNTLGLNGIDSYSARNKVPLRLGELSGEERPMITAWVEGEKKPGITLWEAPIGTEKFDWFLNDLLPEIENRMGAFLRRHGVNIALIDKDTDLTKYMLGGSKKDAEGWSKRLGKIHGAYQKKGNVFLVDAEGEHDVGETIGVLKHELAHMIDMDLDMSPFFRGVIEKQWRKDYQNFTNWVQTHVDSGPLRKLVESSLKGFTDIDSIMHAGKEKVAEAARAAGLRFVSEDVKDNDVFQYIDHLMFWNEGREHGSDDIMEDAHDELMAYSLEQNDAFLDVAMSGSWNIRKIKTLPQKSWNEFDDEDMLKVWIPHGIQFTDYTPEMRELSDTLGRLLDNQVVTSDFGKRTANDLRKQINSGRKPHSTVNIASRIDKIREEIPTEGLSKQDAEALREQLYSKEEIERLRELSKKDPWELTEDEVQSITEGLQKAEHVTKSEDKFLSDFNTARISKVRDRATESIKNNAKGLKSKLFRLLKLPFSDWEYNIETFAQIMDGFKMKGPVWRALTGFIEPGFTMWTSLKDKHWDLLKNEWDKRGVNLGEDFESFTEYMYGNTETRTIQTKDQRIEMTPGQLISFYLTAQQEDGIRHLKSKDGFELVRLIENTARPNEKEETWYKALSNEDIVRIKEELTEQELTIARGLTSYLEKHGKKLLNEASQILDGVDKADQMNYWMLHVASEYHTEDIDDPPPLTAIERKTENSGYFKERVESSKPLTINDAFVEIDQYIATVSAYRAISPAMRDVRSVLHDSKFVRTVDKYHGKDRRKKLQEQARRLEDQSTRIDDVSSFVNYISSRAASSIMTAYPLIWMAQVSSYPQIASYVPLRIVAKFARPLSKNEKKKADTIIRNSPQLHERVSLGKFSREAGSVNSSESLDRRLADRGSWRGWLMKPLQFFDKEAIRRVALAADAHINETQGQVLPDVSYGTSLDDKTQYAEDLTRWTQPTWATKDRSYLGGSPNPWVRSVTMFHSFLEKQVQDTRRAFGRKSSGIIPWKKFMVILATKFLTIWGWNEGKTQARKKVWRRVLGRDPRKLDEEDAVKDFLARQATGVFELFFILDHISRGVYARNKWGPSVQPSYSLASDTATLSIEWIDEGLAAIGSFLEGERYKGTDKKKWPAELHRSAEAFMKLLGRTTGLPLEGIVEIERNMRIGADQEPSEVQKISLPRFGGKDLGEDKQYWIITPNGFQRSEEPPSDQ